MTEIIYIIFTSISSIVVLFCLAKLMGNRQMSQLSLFDYINGITIGSIAAEMATSLEDFIQPLIAMVVYAGVVMLCAMISTKSIKARKFLEGKSQIILNQGVLDEEKLRKARLDISEFLIQCRNSGYFDLSQIETAILEANGKISFLPVSSEKPITPKEMKVHVPQEKIVTNVIMDGKVMEDNLTYLGKDYHWLEKQINGKGAKKIGDVFLAICDKDDKMTVYLKNKKTQELSVFH